MDECDGDRSAVVSAINTASSTAAIRSLGRRGIHTIAISEHDNPPAFSSRYCDERVPVPDPNVDLGGYEAALCRVAERPDVATVLPFREADVYVLARNRERLAGGHPPPWPSLGTLRQVQDRVELFAAAERADVATPDTALLGEWDRWDERAIVKPRYTVHAVEYDDAFERSRTEQGSTRYVDAGQPPDEERLRETFGHEPLAQAYVPTTDEYGFFALCEEGRVSATFQHRQRRGWKYAGGPSAYREAIWDPDLEAAGRRLLAELDWHGVAMVEFLRDPESDEFQLMEVNPRFWSSLPFTIQAGVDFPYRYWRQAIGDPVGTEPTYRVGAAGHFLRGELLHLHSILAEEYPAVEKPPFGQSVGDVAASLVRHPRFDYLSIRDPGPFLRDVANTAGSVSRLS